jgi:hypothetical protein
MVTHFMLSNKVGAFVFLTCFFFSCTAQTISCPEQIKTNSTLLDKNPEWEAVGISYPQYFEQISLTSGHPDEQATLVPDIENKKHIGWSLSAGEEVWMVCNYLSSNVRLAKRLPVAVRRCFVKLKPVGTKAVRQDNELICK